MRVDFIISLLSSLVTYCLCGEHPDGKSEVSRIQDALGNYQFSYKVANREGDHFREEGTDSLGRVIGSYGLKHSDGTHRVVDYIADKDGFRASVRSNEPGLVSAEAADASIIKTDQNGPLSVAATSDNRSKIVFGRRIDPEVSKVEYVEQDSSSKKNDGNDEFVRESRQRNFDDYRPLNPVAYYPADTRSPLRPAVDSTVESVRSPRLLQTQNSEADSKPLDVYFPPIDPHSAIRPPYYLQRDRSSNGQFYPTSTSQKPYIPPYGGFDDDDEPTPHLERQPELERRPGLERHPERERRPEVPIRSGLRPNYPISPIIPPSSHSSRRFPPNTSPEQRNFDVPRFPPSSEHSRPEQRNFDIPRFPPSSERTRPPVLPPYPQNSPPVLFRPPSYDGRIDVPKIILKAVPIPNGIQAVRVDPETGRVYERLVYPLFLRHDGHPEYDRNILLHNDDVSDDDAIRNDDPGYLDMPYLRRPYRGARNHPSNDEGDNFRNSRNNRTYYIDEHSLSEPSAADFSWIKKQLDLVEGFNTEHFANRVLPNRLPLQDPSFPRDYFDDEHRQLHARVTGSLVRPSSDLLGYSSEADSARGKRSHDDLVQEGSKTTSSKLVEKEEKAKEDNNSESKED